MPNGIAESRYMDTSDRFLFFSNVRSKWIPRSLRASSCSLFSRNNTSLSCSDACIRNMNTGFCVSRDPSDIDVLYICKCIFFYLATYPSRPIISLKFSLFYAQYSALERIRISENLIEIKTPISRYIVSRISRRYSRIISHFFLPLVKSFEKEVAS